MYVAWSQALSLADPSGSDPIVATVHWFEVTFLGPAATTVSVLAVAAVGLLMLGGRVRIQRGVTVIVGCFILAGAGSIAAGIQGFTSRSAATGDRGSQMPVIAAAPLANDVPLPPRAPEADPFAGAAVPPQR